MLIIPEIISQTFSKPRAMNLYSNRSWVMTNHNARNIRHMVETLIDHSFRPISARCKNYFIACTKLLFLPLTGKFNVKFSIQTIYVFHFLGHKECEDALGMENGAISDGQITASSFHTHPGIDHGPYLARLHLQHISDARAGGWLAELPNDASQWLQIDLGNQYYNVTRVATQGRQSSNQKVTKYKLQYSDDGVVFSWYENDQGQPKVSNISTFKRH